MTDPGQEGFHSIVVFGCPAANDGRPLPPLRRRLQVALQQAQRDPSAPVIVSGGNVAGPNEAQVMRDWLVERGVDADRLMLESNARDTLHNAMYVAPLLRDSRYASLVTERFHMHRSRTLLAVCIARQNLRVDIRCVPADDSLDPTRRVVAEGLERIKLLSDMARLHLRDLTRRV